MRGCAQDPGLPPAIRVGRDKPLLRQAAQGVGVELEALSERGVVAFGHLGCGWLSRR